MVDDTTTNNHSGGGISFNNIDYARDESGTEHTIEAPKTIDRLEEISQQRNAQRKLESEEDDDDSGGFNEKLVISDQHVNLTDINTIDEPELQLLPDLLIDDIEVL
jgi:hypothetical protein